MHIMISTLVLLAAVVEKVTANHYTCNWNLGPGSPTNYGFRKFCRAPFDGKVYHCEGDYRTFFGAGRQVADWNVLREHILEFGTPCGWGGYGKHDGICLAKFWAVCAGEGDHDYSVCKGLKSTDDCEWDTGYIVPPSVVDIFWKP